MRIDGIPVEDVPFTIPNGAIQLPLDGGFAESGNFKIKWIRLKAGETCIQHIHVYDHATLVVSGVIRVFVEDENKGVFYPMELIQVDAGKRHYMQAETDSVFACIHYIEES